MNFPFDLPPFPNRESSRCSFLRRIRPHYFFSLRICQTLKAAQHAITATRINPINRESIGDLTSLPPEDLQVSPMLRNINDVERRGNIPEIMELVSEKMLGTSCPDQTVCQLSFRQWSARMWS